MNLFVKEEKRNIGKIVREVRTKLNITIKELAEAVTISEGSIKVIESGTSSSIDNIIKVVYFLGFNLSDFTNRDLSVPREPILRNQIIEFHRKHKIIDSLGLLNKQPMIKILVLDRLVPTGYLNTSKTVGDIQQICKDEYSINLNSSSISNTLHQLVDQKILRIENTNDKILKYIKS